MDLGKNDDRISWSCWLRTVLAGLGAMVLLVFVGMNEAQSSVMLPQLKKADSLIRVTPEQETWIASLNALMAPVSALVNGPFIDAFGRKRGLKLFYLNVGLGYAVMSCAREVYQIYIGRILCGLSTGQTACAVVYLAEICTKQQREVVFSTTSALFASGVALSCIIGSYLHWQRVAFIFSVTASVFFIVECFIPESPAWLFKIGGESDAILSLQTLGRSKLGIQRELEMLKLRSTEDQEQFEWKAFLEPTVWKPFVIMVTFFFLVAASGIFDLLYYLVDFAERLGTTYDPTEIAVLLSGTRFLTCSTIVVFFRSKVGRKFAVAFSGFWMTVTFVGLGSYEFVYRDVIATDRPYHWLPVALLLCYMAASNLGMLGLPVVMSGEVYPLRVRGTMASATVAVGYLLMFCFVKIYHVCIDALQFYGLQFTFAGSSFVAILFAIFVLPETQNKSLLEIEQGFLPNQNRRLETSTPQITKF